MNRQVSHYQGLVAIPNVYKHSIHFKTQYHIVHGEIIIAYKFLDAVLLMGRTEEPNKCSEDRDGKPEEVS